MMVGEINWFPSFKLGANVSQYCHLGRTICWYDPFGVQSMTWFAGILPKPLPGHH